MRGYFLWPHGHSKLHNRQAIASGLCLSDAHCLGNDVRKEMRKPGRPPYVSRREEAKEGKDYRDVIQTLSYKYSCVFLDLFYKTTEPCLWKRHQLDMLMHFWPFLGVPQWDFLYLKGEFTHSRVVPNLCEFVSCVGCKSRYFQKQLSKNLTVKVNGVQCCFRPLCFHCMDKSICLLCSTKKRKGLEWHEGE